MQFEDLEVWKKSHLLTVSIFKLLSTCKDYGFKDEITRASLSIPSNIAEGFVRFSNKDTIRFLYYAKASCAEVRAQIYVGRDIGLIAPDIASSWIVDVLSISKMLHGLIASYGRRS
jgi:four helix bundle protein